MVCGDMKPILMILMVAVVAGCTVRIPPGGAPKFGTIFDGMRSAKPDPVPEQKPLPPIDTGLVQREPDSCGAANMGHLVGQPEGMMRTVRTKGRYRVITPNAIVTQEYDSFRLDVHVDADGVIQRFSCG